MCPLPQRTTINSMCSLIFADWVDGQGTALFELSFCPFSPRSLTGPEHKFQRKTQRREKGCGEVKGCQATVSRTSLLGVNWCFYSALKKTEQLGAGVWFGLSCLLGEPFVFHHSWSTAASKRADFLTESRLENPCISQLCPPAALANPLLLGQKQFDFW